VNILVLSARPDTASNRRLAEAAAAARVRLEVVNALNLAVDTDSRVRSSTGPVGETRPDVVLARVGNWRPDSLLAILESLTSDGVKVVNPAPAIRIGRDHWRTARTLATAGLPVPLTIAGADPETVAAVTRARLCFPVVVKQRRSRMGVGVIRCAAPDHLEAVLDSLWRVGDEIVVQQYVETGGRSLRLLVVGERVVAAAEFRATDGEWRSNAARGGAAVAVDAGPELVDLAVSATRAVGLGVCGVDLLPGSDGPVIGEINPTPGFVGLEAATGVDVASAIVDHLVESGRS
jgi:RimK family alpha-L-glutamate ligase